MSDLGNTTNGILDDTTDLVAVWKTAPWRRDEFKLRELADIERARDQLAGLALSVVIHMNRKKIKRLA